MTASFRHYQQPAEHDDERLLALPYKLASLAMTSIDPRLQASLAPPQIASPPCAVVFFSSAD
jgi:hypothetical protein